MTTSATGSTTTKTRMTGLVSGFDTTAMVESLMAIEKQPYTKLDVKKQTEELKLQAYQAVNTYLLKFRASIANLSSTKLWNSKTTTSSNEKSLTATANELAVKGSYSFKVAQLATATHYMSKGFANSKDPLVAQKEGEEAYSLGSINLSSAKTRVDNSAKLEELNGGNGIYRGSIRISDKRNNSATIDLSTCVTMDDVVRTINDTGGINVNATIKDGSLHIADESGGTGIMKITNVGTSTTATDLGIAGSSAFKVDENGVATDETEDFIHGRNVYTLGKDMSLNTLNDGTGIEEGNVGLRVYSNDAFVDVIINVDDCKTVGDIMKRANAAIAKAGEETEYQSPGYGRPSELLDGLTFGISADGTSFGLTGVKEGFSYQFLDADLETQAATDTVFSGQAASQLGLVDGKKSVVNGQTEVSFGRVLGDVNSPMLKNMGGVNGTGVGDSSGDNKVLVAFNSSTKVADLNQGEGIDISNPLMFQIYEGGTSSSGIDISPENSLTQGNGMYTNIFTGDALTELVRLSDPDEGATVGELVDHLNKTIQDFASTNDVAGLRGMEFVLDEYNNRIIVSGVQEGYEVEINGTLAESLGVRFVGNSKISGDSSTDTAKREAIDTFYGMTDDQSDIRGVGAGNDFLDDESVLTDLAGMFPSGTKLETDAEKQAALQSLFGSGGFEINFGRPTQDADGNWSVDAADQSSVSIDWSNLKTMVQDVDSNGDPQVDADGNPVMVEQSFTIDENTTVDDFLAAVNHSVKTGMKAELTSIANGILDENDNPLTQEQIDEMVSSISIPEVRVNALGTGLQWSNVDHNLAWEFSDTGSSSALSSMTLAKDNLDVIGAQAPVSNAVDLDPRALGYHNETEVNADTASSIGIDEINLVGINFGGNETDTFDIQITPDTTSGDTTVSGDKISFTMLELRDAVSAHLNADPDNPRDISTLKLDEYMDVLNGVIKQKTDEYNSDKGLTGTNSVNIEFAVGDGQLIVDRDSLTGVECLKTSGGAIDSMGTRTGIARIDIDDVSALEDDEVIIANHVVAASFHAQEVKGLGDIQLEVGGKTFTLSTEGLDQTSTFNDLVAKLNEQLAVAGGQEGGAALKQVSFMVNSAGTGIAVENLSSQRITFVDTKENINKDIPGEDELWVSDAQHLAQDLGLVGQDGTSVSVEAYSHHNSSSVGKNYVSRATSLEQFVGANAELGSIRVTNALGVSQSISLDGCQTLGDVIDNINSLKGFGVYAAINPKGDGIYLYEAYEAGNVPDASLITQNISIEDVDGGSTAKSLGIAGTGTRESKYSYNSVFEGSLSQSIDVKSSDTLETIMYKIAALGNYKATIINDGDANAPRRLNITSNTSGEKNDFVIDSNLDELFGFSQKARGQDGKVLYGDPNGASSPTILSSEGNTNSNGIPGLTLNLSQASSEWTTITVDDDKEAVVEEIKAMVESYNELTGIVAYLDAYDEETGEPGILFGDNSVRNLMDDINEYFYAIFNPDNKQIGSVDATTGKQNTWTWMDLGVSLSAQQSNADGTGAWYSTMELDLDALDEMVASNWDVMSKMLSNQVNASDVNRDSNVKPSANFNGDIADGYDVSGAINGDTNTASVGNGNGIEAKGTIAEGNNTYTIWFQNNVNMSRLSLYHNGTENALKDFAIEYMDSNGQWQTYREIEGNTTDANHFGVAVEGMQALRITASATNSKDDKFRLLDVQVIEQNGLAGNLNRLTQTLGDTQLGFLAERNTEIQANITDLTEQMDRLQERLDAKEEALWRQFTNMETALGQLNSQSDYFTNMMASMNSSS